MALFIITVLVVLCTAVFCLTLRLDLERQRSRRALTIVHQELADVEAEADERECRLRNQIEGLKRELDLRRNEGSKARGSALVHAPQPMAVARA